MENNAMKAALLILLILYVISPVDAVPGLLDDLIFLIVYAMAGE